MGMLIPSNRYMEVKYEELLFEPEKILRQIMEFLELPFENSMIESFYKKTQNKLPQTAEPFHGNLKKPIDKKLAFKWRDNLSYSDQALAYRIAGEVFKELGYPLGNYKMSDWIVNLRKVYHFLKEGTTWRLRKFRKGHL
ncbi:MAG: hypothetical protein GWN56_14720 [Nitrosopumilaceae archaeon]|nr:hypothetical protein [Nitrosopumilaceae archaeon]